MDTGSINPPINLFPPQLRITMRGEGRRHSQSCYGAIPSFQMQASVTAPLTNVRLGENVYGQNRPFHGKWASSGEANASKLSSIPQPFLKYPSNLTLDERSQNPRGTARCAGHGFAGKHLIHGVRGAISTGYIALRQGITSVTSRRKTMTDP